MAPFDLLQALEIAKRAAEAGADVAMQRRRSTEQLHVKSKGIADWVTDADLAAQAAVIDVIRSAYPEHRILAEEEGSDGGDPTSPYQWIIDPIDGTTCYIHGKEDFGTIVALRKQDETILGVMVLPAKQERYWGIRGKGAFFNGAPVVLRKTAGMEDAILCTNIGWDVREKGKPISLKAPLCASLQNYGCCAAELGDILKGKNDGSFFDGIRLWDIAAGFLMIKESGGKAVLAPKEPGNLRGSFIGVASTEPIFEELRKFVFEGH